MLFEAQISMLHAEWRRTAATASLQAFMQRTAMAVPIIPTENTLDSGESDC